MVDMVVRGGSVEECRGAEARDSIGIYTLLSATDQIYESEYDLPPSFQDRHPVRRAVHPSETGQPGSQHTWRHRP